MTGMNTNNDQPRDPRGRWAGTGHSEDVAVSLGQEYNGDLFLETHDDHAVHIPGIIDITAGDGMTPEVIDAQSRNIEAIDTADVFDHAHISRRPDGFWVTGDVRGSGSIVSFPLDDISQESSWEATRSVQDAVEYRLETQRFAHHLSQELADTDKDVTLDGGALSISEGYGSLIRFSREPDGDITVHTVGSVYQSRANQNRALEAMSSIVGAKRFSAAEQKARADMDDWRSEHANPYPSQRDLRANKALDALSAPGLARTQVRNGVAQIATDGIEAKVQLNDDDGYYISYFRYDGRTYSGPDIGQLASMRLLSKESGVSVSDLDAAFLQAHDVIKNRTSDDERAESLRDLHNRMNGGAR